jgi:cathepsin F
VLKQNIRTNPSGDFKLFQKFITDYSKTYSSIEEFETRFKTFQDFLDIVDKRNWLEWSLGNKDVVHGVTQFADLSQKEFQETYLMKPGYYIPREHPADAVIPEIDASTGDVDWRTQANVITPVKNQAQCGSCWAFSATEAAESFGVLQKSESGGNVPLSTEQTCSCTYKYNGCNGGNPQIAYTNAMQGQGGEESNAFYPYTMNCATCGVQSSATKYVTTKGYVNVPKGNLQQILGNSTYPAGTGPPSVCLAAETWNSYTGGVLSTAACTGSTDHCVQAVGYTLQSSTTPTAYWVVRNSWGTSWGIQGYIYLQMSGDCCQIQDDINYPLTVSTGQGR